MIDSTTDVTDELPAHGALPTRAQRGRSPARRRLIVVIAILLCAMGFLLYKGVTSAFVYFKTAQEALGSRAQLGNSTFQLEGVVVPGSIVFTNNSTFVRFSIASGKTRVQVENRGTPPQLFQANIPVVLVGHFVGASNVFSSDQILVKHSNQYIAAHPNRVRVPDGKIH